MDKAKKPTLKSVAPEVALTIGRIKRRIRSLIIWEGLGCSVACLVAMFWLAFVLDYLPVKFGFNELSITARIVILTVTAATVVWVLYRLVLRRLFTGLKDKSIALLIERRYPEFDESMLTTVETTARSLSAKSTPSWDDSLLKRAVQHADGLCKSKTVDIAKVLNHRQATRALQYAAAGLLSVGIFSVVNPTALETAFSRLYLLEQQHWPRENRIELVGLRVEYRNPIEGIDEFNQILPNVLDTVDDTGECSLELGGAGSEHVKGVFVVARGAEVNLTVRAEASADPSNSTGVEALGRRKLPRNCMIRFLKDGARWDRQTLSRVGGVVDRWQTYRLRGTPLEAVFEDITFYLQGGDHRIGPYQIRVVDEPFVESTEMECVFPDYMVDEESGRWTPRSLPVTGRMAVPLGSSVNVVGRANRTLKRAYAIDQITGEMLLTNIIDQRFQMPIQHVEANQDILYYLVDHYGVVSETPHRVTIDSIEDQAPSVEGMLQGIGSAITPSAVVTLSGTVTDDYDVDGVWLEVETPVSDTIVQDVTLRPDGQTQSAFDFRTYAQNNPEFVLPEQNSEVSIVLKAVDKMNLGSPNVGLGDQHTLEVVSSSTLLKLLEQQEVGQRKRLEQILNEVNDIREYLTRTRAAPSSAGDREVILEPGEADLASVQQQDELRILFAQRAILQVDKSSKEIAGVANAFDDIRLQLINNRVDSEDRKIRLAKQIVAPLGEVVDGVLTDLRASVVKLDECLTALSAGGLGRPDEARAETLNKDSIQLVDATIAQLDAVLSILVKYETQNELLDIVRRMIDEQKTLQDEVNKLRQREAFEDLFE